MNEYLLPIRIRILAGAIAEQTPDDAVLSLLGAILTQLGDTLTTIAVQRGIVDTK